jgi:hypothetical protein
MRRNKKMGKLFPTNRWPRFISVYFNTKKGVWQIRIGTPEVVQEGPNFETTIHWAKQFAKDPDNKSVHGEQLKIRIVGVETAFPDLEEN